MPKLPFDTVDVFTSTRCAGNPLAIVHVHPSGHQPSQEQKQAIAREFNLSETVFLHHPEPERCHPARHDLATCPAPSLQRQTPPTRIDIFLVDREIPLAGHPTIGTLWHLAKTAGFRRGQLLTKAGPVSASITEADDGKLHASAVMPHTLHVHERKLSVMELLHLQPGLDGVKVSEAPVVSLTKGVSFALIELGSLEELGRVGLTNFAVPTGLLDEGWTPSFTGCYFYVVDKERSQEVGEEGKGKVVLDCRMIEQSLEDPATGAAACTLTGYLTMSLAKRRKGEGKGEDGKVEVEYEITQGVAMGRRSEIRISVSTTEEGEVDEIRLGGTAVGMMSDSAPVFYYSDDLTTIVFRCLLAASRESKGRSGVCSGLMQTCRDELNTSIGIHGISLHFFRIACCKGIIIAPESCYCRQSYQSSIDSQTRLLSSIVVFVYYTRYASSTKQSDRPQRRPSGSSNFTQSRPTRSCLFHTLTLLYTSFASYIISLEPLPLSRRPRRHTHHITAPLQASRDALHSGPPASKIYSDSTRSSQATAHDLTQRRVLTWTLVPRNPPTRHSYRCNTPLGPCSRCHSKQTHHKLPPSAAGKADTDMDSSEASFPSEGACYPLILDHIFRYPPGTYEIPLRTMYTLNCAPRAQALPTRRPPTRAQSHSDLRSVKSDQLSSSQAAAAEFTTSLMAHITQLPSQPCSLPPTFITAFLRRCFTPELHMVDFPQALTGLDYLKDLETRRRRGVAAALGRLGLENKDNLASDAEVLNGRCPAAASWLKFVESCERKVDAIYTQLYVALRRWVSHYPLLPRPCTNGIRSS
ncbi:hypothetical protein MRB53_042362 [Persea americana]|nr:hypothetical protein MRB53_042362 [Persea americana]